jgi:hypothetical protein
VGINVAGMEGMRNAYEILMGNSKRKVSLAKCTHNIKKNLKENSKSVCLWDSPNSRLGE